MSIGVGSRVYYNDNGTTVIADVLANSAGVCNLVFRRENGQVVHAPGTTGAASPSPGQYQTGSYPTVQAGPDVVIKPEFDGGIRSTEVFGAPVGTPTVTTGTINGPTLLYATIVANASGNVNPFTIAGGGLTWVKVEENYSDPSNGIAVWVAYEPNERGSFAVVATPAANLVVDVCSFTVQKIVNVRDGSGSPLDCLGVTAAEGADPHAMNLTLAGTSADSLLLCSVECGQKSNDDFPLCTDNLEVYFYTIGSYTKVAVTSVQYSAGGDVQVGLDQSQRYTNVIGVEILAS